MIVIRRGRTKLVKEVKICGNEWKLDFWCGEHEIEFTDIKLQCCTLEVYIMLLNNATSIKTNKFF